MWIDDSYIFQLKHYPEWPVNDLHVWVRIALNAGLKRKCICLLCLASQSSNQSFIHEHTFYYPSIFQWLCLTLTSFCLICSPSLSSPFVFLSFLLIEQALSHSTIYVMICQMIKNIVNMFNFLLSATSPCHIGYFWLGIVVNILNMWNCIKQYNWARKNSIYKEKS